MDPMDADLFVRARARDVRTITWMESVVREIGCSDLERLESALRAWPDVSDSDEMETDVGADLLVYSSAGASQFRRVGDAFEFRVELVNEPFELMAWLARLFFVVGLTDVRFVLESEVGTRSYAVQGSTVIDHGFV